jgi:hypothetical protein
MIGQTLIRQLVGALHPHGVSANALTDRIELGRVGTVSASDHNDVIAFACKLGGLGLPGVRNTANCIINIWTGKV